MGFGVECSVGTPWHCVGVSVCANLGSLSVGEFDFLVPVLGRDSIRDLILGLEVHGVSS